MRSASSLVSTCYRALAGKPNPADPGFGRPVADNLVPDRVLVGLPVSQNAAMLVIGNLLLCPRPAGLPATPRPKARHALGLIDFVMIAV